MSSRIQPRWLLAVAFLSSALALGTPAAVSPVSSGSFAEVLSSPSLTADAPFRPAVSAAGPFTSAGGEIRGGHLPGSSTASCRQSARPLPAGSIDSARERIGDAYARLMRAGLHSSSLGTPPPHS